MARGIAWLQAHAGRRRASGRRTHYTGGGFPRVFYLRYHGYPKFFPLWALARYRNLKRTNTRRVALRHVMIIAAVGLERERRIIDGPGVEAIAGGGDRRRLEALLE